MRKGSKLNEFLKKKDKLIKPKNIQIIKNKNID